MALGSALVDRARLVGMQPMAGKVEGSTRASDVRGPWFKARLELPSSPATPGAPDTLRRRVVERPQLLVGRKDADGNALDINVAKRIEVESKQLGNHLWEVTGDPQPMRKRRTLIGWQVELRRVDDNAMDPVRVA